jgi:broad specificity phosphatase PhoE
VLGTHPFGAGMELILIRHGLPLRTEPTGGKRTSVPDPDLSPVGQDQAIRLADWIAYSPITQIYSSPLRRAIQTVQPLSETLGLPIVVEPELREIDFGEDSYIPIEDLMPGDARWAFWRDVMADQGSELIMTFRKRVGVAVRDLVARHPGETVAAACHGGVINAALAEVLGTARTFAFEIGYSSVTRIIVSRQGRLRVSSVNDVSHLRER